MAHRIIIVAILTVFIASVADAQNGRNRRRGAILGGVAGAAIGVAIGDKGGNETAGALIGGAVGAVAGGSIGDRKDHRIDNGQRLRSPYDRPAFPAPTYRQPAYLPYQPIYAEPIYTGPVHAVPVFPMPIQTAPIPHPVTVNDVIQLQRRGLSEATILGLIHENGVYRRPSVSQVIDLHEHGVSERVIAAMQGDPAH